MTRLNYLRDHVHCRMEEDQKVHGDPGIMIIVLKRDFGGFNKGVVVMVRKREKSDSHF